MPDGRHRTPGPALTRVLVLAWGNPSRGDDALGPELLRRLEPIAAATGPHDMSLVTDFQLQPEHAADLVDRELVLFVDASLACTPPFTLRRLAPERDRTFSSHAMSPAAVLEAFRAAFGTTPPPSFLLAIRGERFELGEPIGEAAREHLEAATALARQLLAFPDAARWDIVAARASNLGSRPPDSRSGG